MGDSLSKRLFVHFPANSYSGQDKELKDEDVYKRQVLDAPKDAVLQITYIGYVSQEVKVSGNKELNVVLKEIGRAHV